MYDDLVKKKYTFKEWCKEMCKKRREKEEKEKGKDISKIFGVSEGRISVIKNNKSWSYVRGGNDV